MGLDILDPVFDVLEGWEVVDGIYQNDSIGTLIVRLSKGPEPLLASGVPNLHLHCLIMDAYFLEFKVDSDCGDMRFWIVIIAKSHHEVGLAHFGIPDNEEFVHLVKGFALLVHLCGNFQFNFLQYCKFELFIIV